MQNKKNKQNTFESLLPPVPESYRARMEETLAAPPVETASRTVSVRSFTKKQIIIFIAALVTLLTVGTAFAVIHTGEISLVKCVKSLNATRSVLSFC